MAFTSIGATAQNFTAGNLVITRTGDGTTTLSGDTAPVSLVEYSPVGVAGITVTMPSTGTDKLTIGGNSKSQGQLSLSEDGKYLLLIGYDQLVATASGTAQAGTKVIGRVSSNGTVNLSTKITSGSNGIPRSVVSTNGTDIWATITNNTVFYTTLGNGASAINTGFGGGYTTAVRTLNIFKSQLYAYTNYGPLLISNPALPTATGATQTASFNPSLDNIGFVFLDLDAATSWNNTGYDVLYISAPGDTTAGLSKYYWNGTAWTLAGRISGGCLSVTANVTKNAFDENVAVLYVLTGDGTATNNTLVTYTDETGFSGDISALTSTLVATAGANYSFRGVAFAPQGSLNVDSNIFNENSVNIYKSNGSLNVSSTTKNINNIKVFDIQGRLLAEQKNVNATNATIKDLNVQNQVLIVKITDEDNTVVTKKVLK
jgi:hypothetical protein